MLPMMRALASATHIISNNSIDGQEYIVRTLPRLRARPVIGAPMLSECRHLRYQPNEPAPRPGGVVTADMSLQSCDVIRGYSDGCAILRVSRLDHRILMMQAGSNWHSTVECVGVIRMAIGIALVCMMIQPEKLGLIAGEWVDDIVSVKVEDPDTYII